MPPYISGTGGPRRQTEKGDTYMKYKLYGAAALCVLLACVSADGRSARPLLVFTAAAAVLLWAADKAPEGKEKRPAGPHKRRARMRRRVKLALIAAVVLMGLAASSWVVRVIPAERELPDASALGYYLNAQKYCPADVDYNKGNWPELERVFDSGMDAPMLAKWLEWAGTGEDARAQFIKAWPELAYLVGG